MIKSPSLNTLNIFIQGFYACFDNRNDRDIDWMGLRKMFMPGATIVKADAHETITMDINSFIQPREKLFTSGSLQAFHEWETSAQSTIKGTIATRISSYQKQGTLNDQPYAGSGEKFFQLVWNNNGWQICAILWQDDE